VRLGQDGVLPILSHIPHHMIPLPLRWLRRPDLGVRTQAIRRRCYLLCDF
jgi:hypothetical protein